MVLPAKVSLRRPPGKPGPGHFRSSKLPEDRTANDRFPMYSRLWPTAAQMDLFSKAAAHGLAALIDIRCSRYVRSSINRTGAADPQRPDLIRKSNGMDAPHP
jgi:hypothetical protein